MKTIIAATDFSEEAENALEYAGALAQKIGTKLILFNTFNLPVHTANSLVSVEAIKKLEKGNHFLLTQRAKKLEEEYGIEVESKSGLFLIMEDELEDLFQEYNAGLVVMGMAPKSIEQDIFGNTTTSAIMKLKYPVLAVPSTAIYSKIHHILFACDDIEEVDPSVKERIKTLASRLESKLDIFHVENPDQDSLNNTEGILRVPEFEDIDYAYKSMASDNVVKAIEKEMKAIGAGLLIMIPQRYGFWESLVHRSKTRIMATRSSIPILSIPQ